MNRAVIIYASLLAVALGAAYLSWKDEPDEPADGGQVILELERDQIASVSYESEKLSLTIEPRTDDRGEYLWVESTREVEEPVAPPADKKKARAKRDPSYLVKAKRVRAAALGRARVETKTRAGGPWEVPGAEPPEEEEEPETRTVTRKMSFKAGKVGEEILEELTPFEALRVLEDVPKDRLAEMGLAEADATLTIALEGGKEHVFAVGEEGYGHRNFYIRDRETGTVYLVSAGVIRPLKFGDARLPERRLVGMQREEIERVRVSRGGEQATFVQKNRDDAAKAFWSRQGSESRAPMATSWMSKILRMTASSYVSKDEMPKDPEKVFALEFVGEGDEATKVTFLRSENESGQAQWYARSGFTRGTVELYRRLGQEAADDLSAVLEEGR